MPTDATAQNPSDRLGTPSTPARGRRLVRTVAVAASALVATAVWLVAVPLAGVELAVDRWDGGGTMTVSLAQVVATALIASLAGWASLATLERLTRRPRAVWAVGASVVLVASLGMPLTAAVTTAAAVTLVALHVAVGAILIPALARSAR